MIFLTTEYTEYTETKPFLISVYSVVLLFLFYEFQTALSG